MTKINYREFELINCQPCHEGVQLFLNTETSSPEIAARAQEAAFGVAIHDHTAHTYRGQLLIGKPVIIKIGDILK